MSKKKPPRRLTLPPRETADEAGDLLADLTPLAGDPDAVAAHLRDLVDRLGGRSAGLVALVAVYRTFAECLTLTPLTDEEMAALDRLALVPPRREVAA